MIISPYCYVCFESQAHDSSLSRVPIVSATVPQRQCWLSNKMNENGEPGGVCRYRMDLISLSSWLVIQLVITESMELNVIRRLSLYFQSTTHNSIVQSNQTLNPVLVLPVTFLFFGRCDIVGHKLCDICEWRRSDVQKKISMQPQSVNQETTFAAVAYGLFLKKLYLNLSSVQ